MRFTLDLPLEPERSFSFRVRFCGRAQEVILTPHYGNFAIFSQSMKRDYHRFGDVMVKHIGKQLRTYRATWRMAVASELRRWLEILRSKKGTPRLRFEYVWRVCATGFIDCCSRSPFGFSATRSGRPATTPRTCTDTP